MKLIASPPISPYQPIAKGTNSLVKPSKKDALKAAVQTPLTLVCNPSFREARAGDARWETTRDDDGNGVGEWLCGCGWKRVLHRL